MADTAYGRFMATKTKKKDAARFITERRPKMRAGLGAKNMRIPDTIPKGVRSNKGHAASGCNRHRERNK
eukprot:scaffold5435_cov78-Skeletonema_dohrnii-CCMP3373.AAC.2